MTPAAQRCIDKFLTDFCTSMADDLHTPVVLADLLEPLKTINNILNSLKVYFFSLIPELLRCRAINNNKKTSRVYLFAL